MSPVIPSSPISNLVIRWSAFGSGTAFTLPTLLTIGPTIVFTGVAPPNLMAPEPAGPRAAGPKAAGKRTPKKAAAQGKKAETKRGGKKGKNR